MKMYQLLENPEAWIQGDYAEDSEGSSVASTDETACHWCLVGALRKCYPDLDTRNQIISKIESSLREENFWGSVVGWNDFPGRTYKEVVGRCKKLDI